MTEIKENVPLEVIRKSPALHETIAFWFSDRDHLRSPFPPEIREELTEKAAVQFHKWVNLLDPKAKGEVDDEVIGEKIEEIIFACAMELVTDVEQRITIRYPFMPRPGVSLMLKKPIPVSVPSAVMPAEICTRPL